MAESSELSKKISSNGKRDEANSYLGSLAMTATSKTLGLAAIILGFDIVELWSFDESNQKLSCIYAYASEDVVAKYPKIIVGHYPNHHRDHVLSPKLCEYAQNSSNRCHWKIHENTSPQFSSDIGIPLKTEMAYWVDGDFGGSKIFIVGLSTNAVKQKPSKLKFLQGLGYAIYVAAFDLDEEEASAVEEVDNNLDHKEFLPRAVLSVASFIPSESNMNLAGSPSIVNSIPKYGISFDKIASEVGLSIDESPSAGSPGYVVGGDISPRAQSVENVQRMSSTESGEISSLLKPNNSSATIENDSMPVGAPTWIPSDAFSFPVAEISVRSWVPDNLTMDHFADVKHVADGSNAHIFLAKFDNVRVVVKMIKESSVYDSVAIHEFEIEHGLLIRLNHPHIIKLLGAGRSPRRFIVLEYLGGGTLNTILSQNQSTGITNKLFRRPSFTYANLISKLRDMADAFEYLHSKCHPGASIIHRDLKPDNVGFTSEGVLKLFDFGLCTCVRRRTFETEVYEMTGNTGSLRYMAPEVALKLPYNEKADVYSFGIMAWQMARDKVPFKGMNRDDFMKTVVYGGERPALDKAWPVGFSNLLTSCWDNNPVKRPSFSQILTELAKLIDNLNGPPKKGRSVMSVGKPSPPSSTWF